MVGAWPRLNPPPEGAKLWLGAKDCWEKKGLVLLLLVAKGADALVGENDGTGFIAGGAKLLNELLLPNGFDES